MIMPKKRDTRKKNTNAAAKAKLRKKRIALEILAVGVGLAVLALAWAYSRQMPTPPAIPAASVLAIEDVGLELIAQRDTSYITVYYPKTNSAQVNRVVKLFVDEQLAHFRAGVQPRARFTLPHQRGYDEFTLGVEATRFDDDIVSFVFRGFTRYAGEEAGRGSLDTMTFDLSTGTQYALEALFLKPETDGHLKTLTTLAFGGPEETALAPESFARFALDGDTLRLFLPPPAQGVGIPLAPLRQLLARRLRAPIRGGVLDPAYALPPEPDVSGLEGKKLVALTFDDGPHGTLTPRLLDFLKEQGVHATFFVVGSSAALYPDIVRRAAAEGHQVGSHSYTHKDLTKVSAQTRGEEIERSAALLEELIGYRPTVMRPPYGAQNAAVQNASDVPLILWSIDPRDWETRNADKTYTRVMANARDGDIVLMHDIHAQTIDAAMRVVPALKAEGYTFVTIDQLIAARGGAQAGDVIYNRPA